MRNASFIHNLLPGRAVAAAVIAVAMALPLMGLSTSAHATFAEGEAAYLKGDHYGAFRKFAELYREGDPASQAMVGRMYYDGQGTVRDPATAAAAYEKAAAQGYAPAQFHLARFYLVGAGVKQDLPKAAAWMEKSANQGVLWAMYSLGLMYRDGNGVTRDPVQALKWLTLAAETPETPVTAEYLALAKTAKKEVETALTPDKVAEGSKAAAQWKAAKPVRDEQWLKPVFKPFSVQATAQRTVEDRDDKERALSRVYFPDSK